MSSGFKHLRTTWPDGACCEPPGGVWEIGPRGWRLGMATGFYLASGLDAGFRLQTASGSAPGPSLTRSAHSTPVSHRPDADLRAQNKQVVTGMKPFSLDFVSFLSESSPSLNAGPSGSTSLTKILLFLWLSMCPVIAKPGTDQRWRQTFWKI